jgi:hypothetical protein
MTINIEIPGKLFARRRHAGGCRSLAWTRSVTAGATVLLLGGCPNPAVERAAEDRAGRLNPNFEPTLDVKLRASPSEIQIFPGAKTRVLTYEPEVVSGDVTQVSRLPDSYLGPIIRARTGDRIRVRLEKALSEPTIIHWHGLRVPADIDGHPRFAIEPGQQFIYEFEVRDRAGTYWFHPRAHGFTASQVYAGLAGLLLVSDQEEAAAAVAAGARCSVDLRAGRVRVCCGPCRAGAVPLLL